MMYLFLWNPKSGTWAYKRCTGVCNVVLCGVHSFRLQLRSIAHTVVSLSPVALGSGKTERPLRLIYPQTSLAGVRTTDQQPRGLLLQLNTSPSRTSATRVFRISTTCEMFNCFGVYLLSFQKFLLQSQTLSSN